MFISIALLFVYIIQGFGIFGSSAKYYVGRAFFDEYNYNSIAQFLADYPFSTSSIQVAYQPYAQKAVSLKYDRIGQSAYQAFILSSADTDAKSTFEVVIFIYPILVAIAIFWAARSLFTTQLAWLAMLWAGILTSLTMVHLESFLSQALGIPFLLVFPLFFQFVRDKFSVRSVLAASIILAAGISLYTEYLYLYFFEILLIFLAWAFYELFLHISVNKVGDREYNVKILALEA